MILGIKEETALHALSRSNTRLPDFVEDALRYARHPAERTKAFHRLFGLPIAEGAPDGEFSHMDNQRVAFRMSLIISEVAEALRDGLGIEMVVSFSDETTAGMLYAISANDDKQVCDKLVACLERGGKRNLIGLIDALGDINVVVNGTAVEVGVDMHVVDQEILASNVSKVGADGKPILGDGVTESLGRVIKGPNYRKPNIKAALGL